MLISITTADVPFWRDVIPACSNTFVGRSVFYLESFYLGGASCTNSRNVNQPVGLLLSLI